MNKRNRPVLPRVNRARSSHGASWMLALVFRDGPPAFPPTARAEYRCGGVRRCKEDRRGPVNWPQRDSPERGCVNSLNRTRGIYATLLLRLRHGRGRRPAWETARKGRERRPPNRSGLKSRDLAPRKAAARREKLTGP